MEKRIKSIDKNRVKGISGSVDSNICYVDYPALIRSAGKNFLADKYRVTAVKEVMGTELELTKNRLEKLGFSVKSEII